jgi:hypothetical protein
MAYHTVKYHKVNLEVENHTVTTKLENKIIQYVAVNPDKLKLQINTALKGDYKNVSVSIDKMITKGLLKKGALVKSEKGAEYNGYRLGENGVYFAIMYNCDLDKLLSNYPENMILQEYHRLNNLAFDKKLISKIVRKATQLALINQDLTEEKVTNDSDFLVDMAFGMIKFYNNLPKTEKGAVKNLKESMEQNPETKEAIERSTNLLRNKLKKPQ